MLTRVSHTCPDLEELAAFLDGRLGAEQRAAIMEHLADCAECYTLFKETVKLQAELRADAAPIPRLAGRRETLRKVVFWLPYAAALALMLAGGLWWSRRPPTASAAEWSAPLRLGKPQQVADLDLGPTARGTPSVPLPVSVKRFQLGFLLVGLRGALAAENSAKADAALAKLYQRLEEEKPLPPGLLEFYQGARVELQRGQDPRRLLERADSWERRLTRVLPASPVFELGKWTAAARLATAQRSGEFWQVSRARRFPGWFLVQAEATRAPGRDELEQIRGLVRRQPFSAANWGELARRLDAIQGAYRLRASLQLQGT